MPSYSLDNQPSGVTIDALTGIISYQADSLIDGVYTFDKIVDDAGQITICPVTLTVGSGQVEIECEGQESIDCDDCFDSKKSDIQAIAKQIALECINQYHAQPLIEPPVNPCDKQADRIETRYGHTWVFKPGEPVITDPKIVCYTGDAPDDSDAEIKPQFDPVTGRQLPFFPQVAIAGRCDNQGNLTCKTHESYGNGWIALCDEQETVKCCIYEGSTPTFPLYYDCESSVWDIKGVEYQLPKCLGDPVQLCSVNVRSWRSTSNPASGTSEIDTGNAIPDLSIVQETPLAAPGSGGCNGVINSSATEPRLFGVDFAGWLGNGGTLQASSVETMTLTFELDPVNYNQFGVGMADLFGDITVASDTTGLWMAITDVRPPSGGFFTLVGSHVSVSSNTTGGVWEIDFAIPAAAQISNSIEAVFFGVGQENISNIRLDATPSAPDECIINTIEELAELLTTASPDGTTWYVEDGDVCADVPISQCQEG